jgi:two-component system, NarL family, sensor kinase
MSTTTAAQQPAPPSTLRHLGVCVIIEAMSTRTAAWLAWGLGAISLFSFIAGLFLQSLNHSALSVEDAEPWIIDIGFVLLFISFTTVGALIASRSPINSIGWIFCVLGLSVTLTSLCGEYAVYALATRPGSLPYGDVAAWLSGWLSGSNIVTLIVLLFLLFPNGRLLSQRWRPVAWLALIANALSLAQYLRPGPLDGFSPLPVANPLGIKDADTVLNIVATIGFGLTLVTAIASVTSLVLRFRRARGVERLQMKWLTFAGSAVGATFLVAPILWSIPELSETVWSALFLFSVSSIPISVGIAILKYRLYDIDIIINRTLVYGTLIVIVIGLYVFVVGTAGMLFQSVGNSFLMILATGLVAVLFQPLRQSLQRGINHFMYGERDDPYAVLSRLSQRLEATLAPEAVLPTLVETIAQSLKLPYAGITLNQDGEFRIATEFGRSQGEPIRLPLIYQGEPIGELLLAPRAPGDIFTPVERRLLDDLARQAGIAVHAVRLTTDLQRSRERLVTTREEERRRLRRDLHDGLGPQLASLTLKLETARNRLTDDPLADSLLADLAKRTQDATADIRRLVYELRPPTLDELGLVSALREGATQYSQQGFNGVHITIDAPENLPPLPAAVEVAVYRITQEALTNIVRHAEARICNVRITLDEQTGWLCLEIQDDGRGLSSTRRAGVGLNSMRERAEELGGTWTIESLPTGGTRILVRLPCRLPDLTQPKKE